MAIQSGFFNANVDQQGNYDRAGTAEQFAKYFSQLVSNGVFANPSTNFQVLANNGMTVTVKSGYAWINGYWAWQDVDDNITIDSSSMSLPRIDRVVLRLDLTQSGRVVSLSVKNGVEASSPVAPALTRNNEIYEIALADIAVAVNASSITQSNITDQRLNASLCGIVTGLIDQIDTTTLYNQIQSDLSEFKTVSQADFEAWIATIRGILDDETAGHLLLLIEQLRDDIQQEIEELKDNSWQELTAINNQVTISTASGSRFHITQSSNVTYTLDCQDGDAFCLWLEMSANNLTASFPQLTEDDWSGEIDATAGVDNMVNFIRCGDTYKAYVLV